MTLPAIGTTSPGRQVPDLPPPGGRPVKNPPGVAADSGVFFLHKNLEWIFADLSIKMAANKVGNPADKERNVWRLFLTDCHIA